MVPPIPGIVILIDELNVRSTSGLPNSTIVAAAKLMPGLAAKKSASAVGSFIEAVTTIVSVPSGNRTSTLGGNTIVQ